VKGEASRQAHARLPADTHEDEHGRGGFYGPASHLYRRHPPTDWLRVEGPAAHRAYDLRRVEAGSPPGLWPSVVLTNAEVAVGFHRLPVPARPELRRDADGDELY